MKELKTMYKKLSNYIEKGDFEDSIIIKYEKEIDNILESNNITPKQHLQVLEELQAYHPMSELHEIYDNLNDKIERERIK